MCFFIYIKMSEIYFVSFKVEICDIFLLKIKFGQI